MSKPTYEELEKRIKELEKVESDYINNDKESPESEDHFNEFSELSFEGIAIHKDGFLLDANSRYFEMFGYEREELIKKQVIPLTVESESIDILRSHIESKSLEPYEAIGLRKDGTRFPIEILARQIRYREEDVRVGIIRDLTESKKTEETIQRSKILLESSIESPKDMIILSLDREYRYLYFNKIHAESMNHVFGTQPEIGNCIFDFMNGEDDIIKVKAHYDRAMSGDGHVVIEEYGQGDVRFFYEIQYNPIYNDANEIIGVTSFAQNITERKKVEDELIRFKAIAENAAHGTAIVDVKGNFIYVNNYFAEIHGYEPSELSGKNLSVFHNEKQMKDVQLINKRLIKEGSYNSLEVWHTHKDGTEFPMLMSGTTINDKHMNPLYFCTTAIDITKYKKNETALIESENRHKALSEVSNEAIFFSEEGICVETNQAAVNMFGYSYDELIGIFGTDVIAPESKELVKQKMLSGYEKPYEAFALRKDGTIFSAEFYGEMFDYNGKKVRATSIRDLTENKRIEAKLKESQLFNETILNSSPDVIYVYDIVERMNVYSNDAIINVLGYTTQDMKDMGEKLIETLMHPDDFKTYCKETLPSYQSAEDKEYIEHEYRMRSKDGEWRWLHAQESIFLRQEDGAPKQIFGIIRDITESLLVEEALTESEEKYRSLTENINMGLYRSEGQHGEILEVNPAFAEMFGFDSKEDVMSINPADVYVNPEDRTRIYTKLRKESAIENYEVLFKREDGTVFYGSVTAAAVKDSKGNIKYFDGLVEDVTESKKAEEALRDSEANLKEAQNTANMGSWAWELKTNIVTWSDNLCLIHGMKPEEFDGTFETATSLIHPDDLEKVQAKIKQLHNEKLPVEFEYRIITKDRVIKFVQGAQKLIFDDKGNVIKMIGNLQDITERRQLEEQLQIRQRMDSLGTLAGGIAHDFNNILVGILGNIELLSMSNENFTEDQKELLNDADQSCDRAAKLIWQFQTLSTGAVRGKSLVDIHDISKEVFNLIKETTDRIITKQVKFKKDEYFVTADPGELHQVLLNLATNSAQAIEERGAKKGDYIRIEAEDYEVTSADRTGLAEGDYVHISFADSGMGMSEEVLKKAFDPLFTTKDDYSKKGQGLGLAMVYNIVTVICKGHIYIDSKEGKGTTFHIYLPLAQPETETESKKAIDIKGGTETILVVDDEQLVTELVYMQLTKNGYTVLTASDGIEGLKIYKEKKDSIDAVILDLAMPLMSGNQVFQELRDINPDVKVIISSGHGDEYSKKGILAEAKGNVGKPYTMKDLAQTVRTVLDL
ncbi:MAG: PAS domain S-box protein [bacterium]|nr:PAS domain S-box protein [bacterium]